MKILLCNFSIELADDEKQRQMKDKQALRDQWEEQVEQKQRKVKNRNTNFFSIV